MGIDNKNRIYTGIVYFGVSVHHWKRKSKNIRIRVMVGVRGALVADAALLAGAALTSMKLEPHAIAICCAAEVYVLEMGCVVLVL